MSKVIVTVNRPPLKNTTNWGDMAVNKKVDAKRIIALRKQNFLKGVGIEGETALKNEARSITKTGELGRSFQHRVTNDKVDIFSTMKFSEIPMEDGRPPGKTPPIKALQLWAMKAGLGAEAGFAIARSIARKGTRVWQDQAPKRVTRTKKLLKEYKIPKLITRFLINDL